MNTKASLLLILLVSSIGFMTACAPVLAQSPTADSNAVTTIVSATQTARAQFTPAVTLQTSATGVPSTPANMPIVYYYFIAVQSNTYPAGSVVIQPDELILGPTLSKIARSSDSVTNITSALQAMLNDPRNAWKSAEVGITSITYNDGVASVDLQGEYTTPVDIVLIAARYQILLTVFAEQSVQSAVVTLNGKNIANLGLSDSRQAKPDNYSYTRAEIEIFMNENAYMP